MNAYRTMVSGQNFKALQYFTVLWTSVQFSSACFVYCSWKCTVAVSLPRLFPVSHCKTIHVCTHFPFFHLMRIRAPQLFQLLICTWLGECESLLLYELLYVVSQREGEGGVLNNQSTSIAAMEEPRSGSPEIYASNPCRSPELDFKEKTTTDVPSK